MKTKKETIQIILDFNNFDWIVLCPECGALMLDIEIWKRDKLSGAIFVQRCPNGDFRQRTKYKDEV